MSSESSSAMSIVKHSRFSSPMAAVFASSPATSPMASISTVISVLKGATSCQL